MTSTPSFSSFPDFSSGNEAGPSRTTASASVPSFGSFPRLEAPKRSKRRSRSRSDDERRYERRDRSDDGARDNKRERERDSRKGRDRDRSDRHKRDREDERGGVREKERRKVRSRSRERNGHKYRHSDRDRSAETRYKEEKRRKEREKAMELIRGDNMETLRSDKRKEEKLAAKEEGLAWYESVGKVKVEEIDATPSTGFFSDIVGDRDAVRYGSTSSTSTPRYHREGRNRILGLNEGLRILYSRDRTEKGVEVAPMGRLYIQRYNSRQTQSAASQHLHRVLLLPSDDQPAFDPSESYVDFGLRSARRADDTPTYRDIHQPEEQEDYELEAIQAAIGSYSTLEEEVRKETIETEQYLKSHPRDIDRWIMYSQLHLRLSPDLTAKSELSQISTKTRAEAEVTLSILSRALDAEENNFNSTKLHLAYLKAAEQFWPNEKVTNRWKNVLRELSEKIDQVDMMDLWLGYITWREGNGFGKGDGGVDEVVDVYEECIGRLKENYQGDTQAMEENLVYLFLRACLFLKQAGYSERSLAMFQAIMEITFFKPAQLHGAYVHSSLSTSFDKVLNAFEEFWDTEAARIGESGSKGWRNISTFSPSQNRDAVPQKHTSEDPFEKWLEAETHAESTYSLPGRATDLNEEVEDDPYHTVLFSDIRPFLFTVTSPEVRLQLIYAFLTFLGLPFSPPDVPSSSPASNDPHLHWTLAYNQAKRNTFWPARQSTKRLPWQTVGGEPMDPERTRGLDNPFASPVKCWMQDRNTMLGRKGSWFNDLDAIDIATLDIDVVRNVFSILRPLVPDPAFTLASFAFESAVSVKGAIKFAKSILASDRDNLLLWDGYARLERQRGNIAAARTVYITALQAAISARANGVVSEDEVDLWAGWAEMEFENAEEARALEVVVLAAGVGQAFLQEFLNTVRPPQTPTSISMLKSRQFYKHLRPSYSPSQLVLKSLFHYLTDGIESARSFLLNQLTSVPPSCGEAEQTLQLLTKILHLHSDRHSAPASLSRDTLELALASFPNNTSFLSLYLYGELGGRVYGRVQRLIAGLTSHQAINGGLVVHLWAIWAEAVSSHRTFWDECGTGAERVRLALDKGISSSTGKYCAALWMLYIEFECLMGRHQTAKQLCYRAVASLGGCKPLYLLPFSSSLRPHYTSRELKDWSELMMERGIRLRIPFERYFDTQEDEGRLLELPEDDELQEDELGFLREREVAKPY
ncbi:hypothetical protein I302_104565 [Kwoniella bestiolae CBS 10118]|uniref:Uncharacterized protein n=1 Tax=Kwoniella bestiolae CBS 10118 TaxID=1296100 RepID=A0A1B9GBM6_9TREE|nr:hypothetical protein I302_03271 [Kwoniella bestiolae CBS 10118]OCF28412.1 hypothetical protein I302_03271 [Kwoniella bestiolae CBS 10118]